MSRLPFDPGKMAAARRQADEPLTVSNLAAMIDSALRQGVKTPVRVLGEVSGFRDRTHWYFDLKDANSVVNCTMFASSARRAGFQPADGQEVVATGRVEFWAKGGKVSLLVDRLDAVGEGALEVAFRRLCEKLRAEGLFDESRKRPIPTFPQRIAVVTSLGGAAVQDVLDTARRRCCAVDLLLVDARVQGDGAAAQIRRALRILNDRREQLGLDAVLLTRGGGSREDLWAFNDEALARDIAASSLPVVAAIGHESDTTIAELVADLRCATPTQAAMRLVPDGEALGRQLDHLLTRLRSRLQREAADARRRLDHAARSRALADPASLASRRRERLEDQSRHLRRSMAQRLAIQHARLERLGARLDACRPGVVQARMAARLDAATARLGRVARRRLRVDLHARAGRLGRAVEALAREEADHLDAAARTLDALDPARVLERGYSWTQTADGRIVRSVGDVSPGERIRTRVADGSFDATVGRASAGQRLQREPSPPRRTRRRSRRNDHPDQMDLF